MSILETLVFVLVVLFVVVGTVLAWLVVIPNGIDLTRIFGGKR